MPNTSTAHTLYAKACIALQRSFQEHLKELLPDEVTYAQWDIEWDVNGGVYFFIDGLTLYDKDNNLVILSNEEIQDIQFEMYADVSWVFSITDWVRY